MEVVRRHDAYNFEGTPRLSTADESMLDYYQRLYDAQGVDIDLNGPAMCTAAIRSKIFSVSKAALRQSEKTSTTFYPRPKFYEAQRQLPGSKPTT